MELIAEQILNLLINPPGNLIYFLVISFSIMTSFQVVLAARRISQSNEINRTLIGLGVLLIGQLTLFISSALVWQNIASSNAFLPPLERAIAVLSLIWIIWIWNYFHPVRVADVMTVLLSLATIILFLFTLSAMGTGQTTQEFNLSWFDWGWQILLILACFIGMMILMLRRPNGWGIGFGFMLLILVGAVAHLLLLKSTGNFAPAVRLAQLCAFPLLPSVVQHLVKQLPEKKESSRQFEPERRKHTADPRAVYAWLQLAVDQNPEHVCTNLSRAVAQTMLADLCYLVSIPKESKEILLLGGYDLVREEGLAGAVLDKEKIPAISGAIHRGRPLRLGISSQNNPELNILGEAIGLKEPGGVLFVPLAASTQDIWGGVLLLAPYSNRVWSAEDQTYLLTATESMIKVIRQAESKLQNLEESQQKPSGELTSNLMYQIRELEEQNQKLKGDFQIPDRSPEMDALLTLQKEAQEQITQLQDENEKLKSILQQGETEGTVMLEGDLRLALEEVAHLQNELAGANMKILTLDIQNKNGHLQSSDEIEAISSMIQDLRQPMASIVGYTEILMSESIGILGNLQRKFMERIQNAVGRMEVLLTNLAQSVSDEKTAMELSPEAVNLTEVIDRSIDEISGGIREKQITLHVDLPPQLPKIHADVDALQQIIVGLLQNAEYVTPAGESIRLRICIEKDENSHPYLLIQVSDSGGGINSQDLQNVFSPQYLSNSMKIKGLSDNGIGLAIIKTLTEAHSGRMWVESNLQKTTFSVLIPNYHESDHSGETEL